jgi:hypothetical protein
MFGPTAASEHRLAYSRSNPYVAPDSALNVINGLNTFDPRPCTSPPGLTVGLGPDSDYVGHPEFDNRATFDTPQQMFDELQTTAFRDQTNSSALPAVPCTKQPAQPSLGQITEMSDYAHVYANP